MTCEITINQPVTRQAFYLEVDAVVRYWEDAKVNGVEDTEGKLIPCRFGDTWKPLIKLSTGSIEGWPQGTHASIHYKVCDNGEYWLQDANFNRIAKYSSNYVPDELLCIGDNGFGDYIILNINIDGSVDGWRTPRHIDGEGWELV